MTTNIFFLFANIAINSSGGDTFMDPSRLLGKYYYDITGSNEHHFVTQADVSTVSSTKINLSGRGFDGIETNAFDNAINMTSLDLSDNKISELPDSIFSKLTNLKNLSIANNVVKTTQKSFTGLGNLQFLDISNNQMGKILGSDYLSGLGKSCWIMTSGLGAKMISGDVFGSETSPNLGKFIRKDAYKKMARAREMFHHSLLKKHRMMPYAKVDNRRLQVCIQDGIVLRLDYFVPDPIKWSNCHEIKLDYVALLDSRNITGFNHGWWKLGPIKGMGIKPFMINLIDNKIDQVTSQVLNELPDTVQVVDLSFNKIKHLGEKAINHTGITSLYFDYNGIRTIENNAFVTPQLRDLFLPNNQLKDIKFVATLPPHLLTLGLEDNKIAEIPNNVFSHLENLSVLNLAHNEITMVGSHSLRGAKGLIWIGMESNKIKTIEQGAFDAPSLFYINLSDNQINRISVGSLNVPSLEKLDLSANNITTIEKGSMRSLVNLESLDITANPIDLLPNGALLGLQKNNQTKIFVGESQIAGIQAGLFDDA